MGKYTDYNEEVDDYIEKNYLNKIVKSFVSDCNDFNCNLISVILFGGFGKGEGSVQFIGNKPVPYNDFDFYIVTERKLSDNELNKISLNASKSIGMGGLEIAYFPEQDYNEKKFFHVDVRAIPYNKLNKLMSIQRYYELKYRSKVIYGNKNVLDKINIIKPENIPLSDGLRNLFNRLHQMLLGLNKTYNNDQRKIKIFWGFKVYLSCCEALLILDKKLKPTSRERARLFEEIYELDFNELRSLIPNLAEKVNIATNFKLKPYFNVNHDKLFNAALKDLLMVLEYYIKKMIYNHKHDENKDNSIVKINKKNGFSNKNNENGFNIERVINKKLPYIYFKPFLREKIGFNFFPAQYILNFGYFNTLRNNNELFFRPLLSWKDVGLRMILPIYYLLKYQEISVAELKENFGDSSKTNLKKANLKNNGLLNNRINDYQNKLDREIYLEKAYNELKKFIKIDEKQKNNFWHLRERALKAFGLYYQQRLL